MHDNIQFTDLPGKVIAEFIQHRKYSKVCVLTDSNTRQHCYPMMGRELDSHRVIEVSPGEGNKNIQTCVSIWQAMTEQALDRHSVLVVIGGGVLGDMGGFCAATFKRGIDFILVPTTLLSQVDASIGGKLGIDFEHFKNHLGVFQTPALTVLYQGFLKTLPKGEIRSGFAEIIKHTLISDHGMWNALRTKSLDEQDWQALITHSVRFKQSVVDADPKEKGLRKILNAGHTIGHAIETYLLSVGRPVLHGEAIAAGLICEGYISHQRGMLDAHDFQQIIDCILPIYGRLDVALNEFDPIAKLTLQDKKNVGNKILCVLLEGIGTAKWDCEISSEEVKGALTFYRSLVDQT